MSQDTPAPVTTKPSGGPSEESGFSFTSFILNNRHAVWAIVVATVILGFVAYREIPVRLFPDTAPPLVNVVTSWPGATASDVNRDLTEPLETEFAALEGVARTTSTSQDNVSVIQVEFHYGTDVRMAAVDVDNAVSRLGSELPLGAEQPRVMTFSTADRPVYTVGVRADDLLLARQLAEDVVGPRLQSIAGVAAVDVFGGRVPTVLVDVDPVAAEAHHVALPQVAAAIQAGNISSPAGRVRSAERETMLRVDQQSERVESLGERVIALPDGGQVRLDSVASVYRGAAKDDAWFSVDGQQAIAVQVYRSEDANTVAVVAEVQAVMEELRAELPELSFVEGEESASFTEQSVSNLLSNVWQALLLASLILFFFLGRARAAMVTAFTMPLAFGLSFAVMWQLGMEFNMVTLSAVILAVGMVVDASVVVLENIVRLRDEGVPPMEAARRGTDEVRIPVLAGVATTVVVLIPLLSLPGFVGKVFGPLAMTLLIAFSSSVLVALVMVPILSLNIKEGARGEAIAARIARPFQRLMELLRSAYLTMLSAGLKRRGLVLTVALLSFVVGLVGLKSAGMDLLPRMDSGAFSVSIETPSGSSLERTTAVLRAVERALEEQPEVILVQSQAGFEPGMKFAGGSGVMGPTQGFISVTLTPRTERERSIWQIEDSLRAQIAGIPDIANVIVKEVGNTAKPTTLAPVVARVTGPDPLVLDRLGDTVMAELASVPSLVAPTRAWRSDMKRVVIAVDERQAASMGQSSLSIARQLTMGAEGIPAGMWSPSVGSSEPISVRFARPLADDVEGHLAWPMMLPGSGEIVPIRSVATPQMVEEQGLFTSVDLNPVLDVYGQVDGRPLSFVVADAQAAVDRIQPPEGYRVSIEGENKDLSESRVSILKALAVSVMAVYLLLVAQFRSWIHPLTVMMAVPLSLVGVSAALFVTGKAVSMPVMVGLVLLVGTVVNNAILLVDVIRQRREAGDERQVAIREGVSSRFRPIMMTSLSTVIGMLPLSLELALGAERFSPLATAVIGGLLASTVLTMVVIPVLYDTAESVMDSFSGPKPALSSAGLSGAAGAVALALVLGAAMSSAPVQAQGLDQAWELALEHPAALAADLQVEAATARTHAATGRMAPTVELSARSTQRDPFEPAVIEIPLTLPDGSSPEPMALGEEWGSQQALVATVTQPLFTGGALVQGRKAALAVQDATVAKREGARSELWLNLVQAWYGQAVSQEVVAIKQEVVDSALAREASLQRLVDQGRAVDLQLSAVSLKRAEAQQALAEAQVSAQVASAGLAALLGAPVSTQGVDVVAAAGGLFELPVSGQAASVTEAQAWAAAADAKGKALTGAVLPMVALRASAQYSNPNLTQFPVVNEWGTYWDASIVLTWTLDGGVRWNTASGARLDAQAAQAGSEAMVRQSDVALSSAMAALETAPARMEVVAERVHLATWALQTAESALAVGRATEPEVMERSTDLAMARAAELMVAMDVVLQFETARGLTGAYGPQTQAVSEQP